MRDYEVPTPMFASHQSEQQGGASGYRDMGGYGVRVPPPGHPTFPFPVLGAGGYDEPDHRPTKPVPQLRQGVPASSERYPDPVVISGGSYTYEPGQDVPIKPGAFINAEAFQEVGRRMARAIASPVTVPLFYLVQDPRSHLQIAWTCNVKTDTGNFGPSFYYEKENGQDVFSMSMGPKAFWKGFPFFQGYFGAALSTDENNRGLAWAVSPSYGKHSATMGMNPIIADGQTFFQFSILNRMAFTFARDTIGLQWNVKDFRDDLYRVTAPRKVSRKLGLPGKVGRIMHKPRQWMKKNELDYMCGAGLYVTNPDFLKLSGPVYNNVIDPYLLPAFNTFRKHVLGKSPLPAGYHGRYKDKTDGKPPGPGPVWELPPEVSNFFSSITAPGLLPLMGSLMPSMAPDWEGQGQMDPVATASMMTGLMPLLAALALTNTEEEEGAEEGQDEESLADVRDEGSGHLPTDVDLRLPGH